METTEIKFLAEWDNNLKIGDIINARFTNCYNSYGFNAVITKLNVMTLKCVALKGLEGYEKEREFLINRFVNFDKWTTNNGAFPQQEKPVSEWCNTPINHLSADEFSQKVSEMKSGIKKPTTIF